MAAEEEKLYLGVDLGTSAVKVLAVDVSGRVLASASADSPVHEPGPSMQEQEFEEVWSAMSKAVKEAVSRIGGKKIVAMGFSSAMHGFMAVDAKGDPLFRQWTWADGRSVEQAGKLASEQGNDIYSRTGAPVTALYYPARALWLKENDRTAFDKAELFCSIKDCLVHRLTGKWVTDRSHASSNGLLDIHGLNWDASVLETGGVSERLPELIDSDEPAGELLPEAARSLGLPAGILVVPGAGDGGLANLGSGAVDPGQAAVTIGTSGAMRKISDAPFLHPQAKTWCYYLAGNRWYSGGAINSGGIVLRWLRDGLLSDVRDAALAAGREPYRDIIGMAASAPPGAEGLTFLPYLYGERTPYWNPKARGLLFGLSPAHGKAHLARAVLEGICFAIKHVFEGLGPDTVNEIRATGGFARSGEWVKILASALGKEISIPASAESSALGAAVLAMKASGAVPGLGSAKAMAPVEKTHAPDEEVVKLYGERFETFKGLYENVKEFY